MLCSKQSNIHHDLASLIAGGFPVHAGVVTCGKWMFTVPISQPSMRLRPGLELADSFGDAYENDGVGHRRETCFCGLI